MRQILPISSPFGILAHWIAIGGQPGPVELLFPGGSRFQLAAAVNIIAVANGGKSSRIATVSDKTIRVYDFIGNAARELVSHTADCPIVALDIGGDTFVYGGSNKKYVMFNIESRKTVQLNASPTDTPSVAVLTADVYVLGYREFFLRVDRQGADQSPLITLETARGRVHGVLADKDAIYRYYDKQFTRSLAESPPGTEPLVFEVANVTASVKAQDRLLVVEPTAVRIVGSLPQISELLRQWQRGGEDAVLAFLKNLSKDIASDIAFSLFSELWKGGEIAGALALVAQQPIPGQVTSIIGLIPLFSTGTSAAELPLPKKDVKPNDTFAVGAVSDFLCGTREQILSDPLSKRRNELPAIDVAYAESLALDFESPRCRDVDRLILDGHLDLDIFVSWLDSHKELPLNAIRGVVETHRNVAEALRIFQALYEKGQNQLFVKEAAIAIQRLKDVEPAVVKQSLDWVLANDKNPPEQALVAILSPHHDDALIIQWLEEHNCGVHRLRYYCYLLTHKVGGSARGARIANGTILDLLSLIADIRKDGFDVARISFTEAAMSKAFKGPALVDAAKKELSGFVREILQEQAGNLDFDPILAEIQKSSQSFDKDILLNVYRVAKRYPEALRIMLDDPNLPLDELKNFLRSAPDPRAAFNAFFEEVPRSELLTKYGDFITENLQYVDIVTFLRIIPSDSKITSVRRIVHAALALLLERNTSLNTQVAITQGLLVDAEAKNAQLKASYCTLTTSSTCAACGKEFGPQLLYMEPAKCDGKLYHYSCRPILQ